MRSPEPREIVTGLLFLLLSGLTGYAQDVTLAWDPNSEEDLAGYNVYRTGTSGSGYVQINEGLVPVTATPTFTDSTDKTAFSTVFYVVTAVDTGDLESDFSEEVSVPLEEPPSESPPPSSGGGGGGGNLFPSAADDDLLTPKNTPATVHVLANDTDPNGDVLTVESVGEPQHGSAVLNSDQSVTYTPALDYVGADSFSYSITDRKGGSSSASVLVTVTRGDPIALDDTARTLQGTAVTIPVLDNDTDEEGDSLSVESVGEPARGWAVINTDGTITYTPTLAFDGLELFTYVVVDGNGGAAEATVSVQVTMGVDRDVDGVSDEIEARAPNNGDGNGDGIADSEQDNVTSFPNPIDQAYVTLASPPGTRLVSVTTSKEPSPGSSPEFPVGFFEFRVEGVVPGEAVTVKLLLPDGVPVNTYYKYGPTAENLEPHWYEFLFDGNTGAELNGQEILLHFVDGGRGDDDLAANGVLLEPGGPSSTAHLLNFAQFAEADRLSSEIVIFNLDDLRETALKIRLRDVKGQPLSTHLNGEPTPGELEVTIPAGAIRSFRTDGTGPLSVGSVQVTSERPASGMILFAGEAGAAGLEASPELDNGFILPVETEEGSGINTGIAVMNLEGDEVSLELELFDEGRLLGSADLTISPLGHDARFVNEFNWDSGIDFSRLQALLTVRSSGRIAAAALRTYPGEFATLPVEPLPPLSADPALPAEEEGGEVQPAETDFRLHFAQFVQAAGLTSQIILINLDAEAENRSTIRLRDDHGRPMTMELDGRSVPGETETTIPAGGLQVLRTTSADPLLVGSVTVESQRPLSGVVLLSGDFGVVGFTDSPEVLTQFASPVETHHGTGKNTGIAVMNLEETAVKLDVDLYDTEGNLLAKSSIELDANGHLARFVEELPWSAPVDFSNFKGILKVNPSGKVAATALLSWPGRPGRFAALPVSAR